MTGRGIFLYCAGSCFIVLHCPKLLLRGKAGESACFAVWGQKTRNPVTTGITGFLLVAGAGLEPATDRLWARFRANKTPEGNSLEGFLVAGVGLEPTASGL